MRCGALSARKRGIWISTESTSSKTRSGIKIKAGIEGFVEKSNRKPFSWATIESQEQMEKEIKNIYASYPPGVFGIPSGSGPHLSEKRVYKEFVVIAIQPFPRENGQYSTLSGIRKLGDPASQEPFAMSDQEFPTHEAAIKAAFEDCMKKIDAGSAA